MPKVLGQGLGRERLSLPFAVFVPSTPPTFDVLSHIDS